MSDKFEFNSTVILDGVRQIPGKINVSKNTKGELIEHMGDTTVNGSDIYLIESKLGSVMLTVDGTSTVILQAEHLDKNRHLAVLTVVDSIIEDVSIRGNNTVVRCEMSNCALRDSLVEFTKSRSNLNCNEIKNISFVSAEVKDTSICAGHEGLEYDQVMLWIEDSTLHDSFINCPEGRITSVHLRHSSISTTQELTLTRARLEHCTIRTAGPSLCITNGAWTGLHFRAPKLDVNAQFQMCAIDTPEYSYYFYNSGGGIYCVASHKGYNNLVVDLGNPEFEQLVLDMIADGSPVDDYHRSMAKYVLDSIASRMMVLKTIDNLLDKADGKLTNVEESQTGT